MERTTSGTATISQVLGTASALRRRGGWNMPGGGAGDAAEELAGPLAVLRSGLQGNSEEGEGGCGALLRALTQLRQALSITMRPPIQEVIDGGGLPPLVALLRDSAVSSAARLEAAWILTNVAAGSSAQASAVLEAGAAAALFAVLLDRTTLAERPELCEVCLEALGNLAGDADITLKQRLLQAGILKVLGQLHESTPEFPWPQLQRDQVFRALTDLMDDLCREEPIPPADEASEAPAGERSFATKAIQASAEKQASLDSPQKAPPKEGHSEKATQPIDRSFGGDRENEPPMPEDKSPKKSPAVLSALSPTKRPTAYLGAA
jgi:hypothetical protein